MNTNSSIRTRFAPSPTGMVHIGSLRTALFAYLFARHHGGVNILRIEDTDQNRRVEGAIENLLGSMGKLGIEFDEGVQLENGSITQVGEHGPYIQSERLSIYHEQINHLIQTSKAYYCFCTSERLEELRKEQIALKKPPMYDGKCRNLQESEVQAQLTQFEAAGQRPVVRQAINHDGKTLVQDLVFGDVEYDNSLLDDQVLLKSDGFPTYHLAVVVDDHFMGITHVIRGNEWLPSTPKHIQLFQAFGWTAPAFAHLPLILNPDKSKLSKRQGDVALEDFLQKGFLPEAMLNFIALLGWNPKTEQELFSKDELIAQFDLSKVNKAGAVFDLTKLEWMNGLYIRQKPVGELENLLQPYLQAAGYNLSEYSSEFKQALINIEKERLKKLSDITEHIDFYFNQPEYSGELLVWRKSTAEQTKTVLENLKNFFESLDEVILGSRESFEQSLKSWIGENRYDNGTVLWPLRVALTGLERSPGPFELCHALYLGYGKSGLLSRLDTAVSKI